MTSKKTPVEKTWYQLFRYTLKPEAIRVSGTTKTTVIVRFVTYGDGTTYDRQLPKTTDSYCVRRTKKECLEWLYEQEKQAYGEAKDAVAEASKQLRRLSAMIAKEKG